MPASSSCLGCAAEGRPEGRACAARCVRAAAFRRRRCASGRPALAWICRSGQTVPSSVSLHASRRQRSRGLQLSRSRSCFPSHPPSHLFPCPARLHPPVNTSPLTSLTFHHSLCHPPPLQMGIVGMPNVGKSTLFNTLSKMGIPAENFPFCTIDPNNVSLDAVHITPAPCNTLHTSSPPQHSHPDPHNPIPPSPPTHKHIHIHIHFPPPTHKQIKPTRRASTSPTTASTGCVRSTSPRAASPRSSTSSTSPGWSGGVGG